MNEDHRFDHGMLLLLEVIPLTCAKFRIRFAWLLLCAACGVLFRAKYAMARDIEVRVKVREERELAS